MNNLSEKLIALLHAWAVRNEPGAGMPLLNHAAEQFNTALEAAIDERVMQALTRRGGPNP